MDGQDIGTISLFHEWSRFHRSRHTKKPVILECFESFLIGSQDKELREYPDIYDQIREVLIHAHYLSEKDIVFCLEYNIKLLADQLNHPDIERIHAQLKVDYGQD